MKKIFILLMFTATANFAFPQQEKLQAVFIYNFTKYINWPVAYQTGDFKIGVLGSKAMTEELSQIAQKRKVGIRSIVVENYATVEDIQKCQMLYVGSGKSSLISKAVLKLSLEPTVIISASEGGLKKGSSINFIVEGGKQKFEIKSSNIKKNGLKISDDLLNLGVKK